MKKPVNTRRDELICGCLLAGFSITLMGLFGMPGAAKAGSELRQAGILGSTQARWAWRENLNETVSEAEIQTGSWDIALDSTVEWFTTDAFGEADQLITDISEYELDANGETVIGQYAIDIDWSETQLIGEHLQVEILDLVQQQLPQSESNCFSFNVDILNAVNFTIAVTYDPLAMGCEPLTEEYIQLGELDATIAQKRGN
jgi:hypothetical protein